MAAKSLLLLEDDQNLSDTICDYLEEYGYVVTPVYDSSEAEEKLYEQRYDLLLLDVNIPGSDGFKLLKWAREEGVEAQEEVEQAPHSRSEGLRRGLRTGGGAAARLREQGGG